MSGINDFAFKMGTVNGTGSASANSLLMKSIFRSCSASRLSSGEVKYAQV